MIVIVRARRVERFVVAAVAALVCLGGWSACASQPKPVVTPPPAAPASYELTSDVLALLAKLPELRPREELPDEVRDLIAESMEHHAEQMVDLLVCVVMLEYALVARVAARLGEEPKLGSTRPVSKASSATGLPRAFYAQQEAMVESARALAHAAREHDDVELVSSFASLTRSCVGCHAVYRHARFDLDEPPVDHEREDEPVDGYPCLPGQPCSHD